MSSSLYAKQVQSVRVQKDNSPYCSRILTLYIELSGEYPFKPPTIRFNHPVSLVYHPNVDITGDICIPILSYDNWKPATTVEDGIPEFFHKCSMGIVGALADALNTREDGLRLLLSILAGYPLAVLHRTVFYNKSTTTQHVFFVTSGVALYLFNCGYAIIHSLVSILFAFGITNFMAGTQKSVIAAHVAFLGHLLIGYWFAESDKYDITWTTPFCIMTLRFIGLVMDVYDGVHYLYFYFQNSLRADQQKTAVRSVPGLLEIAAFGTLAGPQFSLSRFRSLVNGEFLDDNKEARQSALMPSLGRFIAGCTYMVLHQWGAVWIPLDYFNSHEFFDLPFLWRWTWVTIWFRLTMYRYCAVWLITEGAAILTGIGYNGKDKDGMDRYVGVILLYYLIDRTPGWAEFIAKPFARPFVWLFGRVVINYSMAFAFLCFGLIKTKYWIGVNSFYLFIWTLLSTSGNISSFSIFQPVQSLYFVGFIIYFLIWPLLFQILKRILPRKQGKENDRSTHLGESNTADVIKAKEL
uniref:Lysophospholipid acyltransferase 5 n=1 Tax=Heterorhabditis bacteriophora TaxID=37862 RepID=A0A1I7XP76_HETBA